MLYVALVVFVLLIAAGIRMAHKETQKRTITSLSLPIKFISSRNNSGKFLYRAIVRGKVWTSSDPVKLRSLIQKDT